MKKDILMIALLPLMFMTVFLIVFPIIYWGGKFGAILLDMYINLICK